MSCKFAQREMKKEVEKLRCVNKACDSFLEIVEAEVCSGCPLNVSSARNKTKGGCTNCPDNMEPSEPYYGPEDPAWYAQDMEAFEEDTQTEEVKEFPPLMTQLGNYKNAVRKWISAGRPVRTPEEIKDILENKCKRCAWYDGEAKRCKGCGCQVTESIMAIFNKIKMATEHCPKELW